MRDNIDKTLGRADTPSKQRKQEGANWETRGDKTLGKADAPTNQGKQEGVNGRQKGRQDS